jgi:hypothetical protein
MVNNENKKNLDQGKNGSYHRQQKTCEALQSQNN